MVAVSFALGGETPSPPFLELETKSDVKLVDPTEAVGALPQALRSVQLETLSFLYGGFDATSLRAHVSQGAEVWRMQLRPVVDAEAGTLQLSRAQPQWREVVQYLAANGGKGPPMDLSFVVPGAGSLGTARVRVDDTPPHLEARLDELENGAIVGRSLLVWAASDEVGLASVFVDVVFADGSPRLEFPLRGLEDRFELGKAIGERVESLALSARGSWRVALEGGATVELGRGTEEEVLARTQAFTGTVTQLTARYQRALEHADLRHTGGYALRLQGIGTVEAKASAAKK